MLTSVCFKNKSLYYLTEISHNIVKTLSVLLLIKLFRLIPHLFLQFRKGTKAERNFTLDCV
jgi:hypothetical protein